MRRGTPTDPVRRVASSAAPSEAWPEELDAGEIAEVWEEPWGDRRQELVVIGARLADDLLERLHDCCLTDAELASGPPAWQGFDDPFPAWRIAPEDGGDSAD